VTGTKLKLAVPQDLQGLRLDIFCSRKVSDRTRSYFTKLASSGHIKVDGRIAKPSLKVKRGMQVEIELAAPPPIEAKPEDIPLDIIYEDDRLAVVNKPAGMVVHPAAGNYEGTLVNALMHHFGETVGKQTDSARPGLVHRLDRDTSGLLVVARDEKGLAFLQRELKERRIKRHYKAICWGCMEPDRGTIDLPIGRSERDRKKMVVYARVGRQAVTHYEVLERLGLADLVLLKLETGRTHQIRVHLSHFGHPVIGDPTYGGRSKYVKRLHGADQKPAIHLLSIMSRQALHAFRLHFPHPDDGKMMEFEAELPEDISEALEFLRSRK
jgi:23S rRNA pseudouridine1911/1915/1917 synthase